MLHRARRTDIAVGYLFLSGFNQVADELCDQQQIRILVGRTDRATLDAVAAGLQQTEALRAQADGQTLLRKRDREDQKQEATQTIGEGVSRLSQDEASERNVHVLSELIARGALQIRTYPRGLIHAKAYICHYSPEELIEGQAIVGSSNFTLAGFEGNTELNVRLTDQPAVHDLSAWFEALWNDSVDITEDVQVELQRSWALARTRPYDVYLKALYELYRDELGLPPLEPGRRGVELANFQQDAVRHALGMIDRHGGCFIGDVVGLGKTYVGAEIVRQLQFTEPAGRHPLIICPAGLRPMWERVNEIFGLGAAVVSMSALRPPGGLEFDEEEGEYLEGDSEGPGINLEEEFPNRGVVLVDEVHNFRNAGTNRYKALSNYLWNGDHKTVLLSATPQNLGPRDIYNELRLFLDEADHGLNIEPLRLSDYFNAVQQWYDYELDLQEYAAELAHWEAEKRHRKTKLTKPAEPQRPKVPRADITTVLLPVFIRRRRKDVKELYGDSARLHGKTIVFPKPDLENLTYRLDRVYERAFHFDELTKLLEQHSGARYRALDFLKPEAADRPEYRDLKRARTRVAALTRFLLVKRLESSVEAFRSTLGVLIRSNRNFRAALDAGFVPIGTTATAILAGHSFDTDDLLERLQTEEQRRQGAQAKHSKLVHSAGDFNTAEWKEALDRDYEVLRELQERLGRIAPADDDKLQSLKAFLARPEVASGKVLIFSEAEATVDYLFEGLNPGGADLTIARISGANRDSIQETVRRFSPRSNLRPKEKLSGPEIRVLLATDVVSEGQNLQDCNRVVNYDLHWNPVRLIQRFGRVDRIGTEHETIHLHNTWPDLEVDEQLDLTRRLEHRIQQFHDMIGLDAPLLSGAEKINPRGMFAIYDERRLPGEEADVLDPVAAHQRGIALLQQLEREDPDQWRHITSLPDGIRSALRLPREESAEIPAPSVQQSMFDPTQMALGSLASDAVTSAQDGVRPNDTVVLLAGDGTRLAYAVGDDLEPRWITTAQLIGAIACEPDTPPQPLLPDTNKRVMAAYRQARDDLSKRLGRAARVGGDTQTRRYLRRKFRQLRAEYGEDDDQPRRIGILERVFNDAVPPKAMEALSEMRRMDIEGDILLRRLEALRELYRLNPPEEEAGNGSAMESVVRIVCSDGLL